MKFYIENPTNNPLLVGDGVTKTFNVLHPPFVDGSLWVIVHGQHQTFGIHYTELSNRYGITFITAPPSGWPIEFRYFSGHIISVLEGEGTTFKENMARDAQNVILNTSEFAEDISYTAKGEAAKDIKAIVIRQRLDMANQGSGRLAAGQAEIHIANDDTYGISPVTKGVDKASFPEIEGGADIDWVIADIISSDDAMWHLLVQK